MRFPKAAKRILVWMTTAVLLLSVSGCKGIELENKTEQIEEYTRPQAMIFLANERNRYQNAYSDDIWSIAVDEDGGTFDQLTVSNVKAYLEKIKLLCMMAEEYGVAVNSRERDMIRQMTDEYINRMSEADKEFIGCSREDVSKMYTEYYTACKMADSLVKDASVDISDSEVKVISIMQIGTVDEKKAKAILKKVKIDGSDFNSMASRYSELGQIEVELKKGTANDIIEKAAFSLEEGKISNILYKDGMYYIIKCVNGYNREATDSRKQGIRTALNSLSFQKALEPYEKEHKIVFMDSFWKEVDLTAGKNSTIDSFFDIYSTFTD